jgi:glycosyltransferase involved in cell wall biosynthesis
MRVGHNPARFVENVSQPADITVAVVNCIPFLSGYYEQSLEVLKATVESLYATRDPDRPYDMMVFDNHSCAEVQEYLLKASRQGKIQYLVISDTNIGKIGAWNYMFGAAQGEYVVFSDGDILFRPGWLQASLELFETFPNVGMVTARPYRASQNYSKSTFDWAHQHGEEVLEEGSFMDWETAWEHFQSVGVSEEQARQDYSKGRDYRLTYHDKRAYIGAGHYQFMSRRELLHKILPLPSTQPMRGERALDTAIDNLGCLRLTTIEAYILHMGNRPSTVAHLPKTAAPGKHNIFQRLVWLPGIRHILLWIHNQIFRLYFLTK